MSFLVQTDDPLAELQTLALPKAAVLALAILLVVESLVGSTRASSVERFMLGPNRRGQRHLQLTWREPRGYDNVPPQPRSVEGIRRWG